MVAFSRLLLAALLVTASLTTSHAQQKLKYPKEDKGSEIYDTAQKPAEPVGGVAAYGQYLADNQ